MQFSPSATPLLEMLELCFVIRVMLGWGFTLLLHFLEVFAVQKQVKHFLDCVCRGWRNLKEDVPFVLQFAFVLEPEDYICHLGMGC